MLLFAVLLFADLSVKSLFEDSSRAYCNPDGPWGWRIGIGMMTVLVIFALAGIVTAFVRNRSMSFRIVLIVILAGGTGNLLDRALLGCVRDYTIVPWFPAFNLADMMITAGAVLALWFAGIRRSDGHV
ncbi:MAG: signal peptidase II [Candidatus Moranbacteria bacterium]|nr:signal peptidase II [Candidatus Moranbacteria bacterium]